MCTYHLKKKVGWICGNDIAEIGGNFFFFFLRNDMLTQFLQQILIDRLLLLD